MSRYPAGSVEQKIEDILNLPEKDMYKELNKIFNTARVRIQRLNKIDHSQLAWRTIFAREQIEPYLNKKGNVSLNAKTLHTKLPFKLREKAIALERFNRNEVTSVAGTRKEFAESAARQGFTVEQFSTVNRLWKWAYDRGLLDRYDPSDYDEDIDEMTLEGKSFEEIMGVMVPKLNAKLKAAGLDYRINPNTYNVYHMPKPDNMGVRLRLPKVKIGHSSADPDFIDETIKLGYSGTVIGWKPPKKKKG